MSLNMLNVVSFRANMIYPGPDLSVLINSDLRSRVATGLFGALYVWVHRKYVMFMRQNMCMKSFLRQKWVTPFSTYVSPILSSHLKVIADHIEWIPVVLINDQTLRLYSLSALWLLVATILLLMRLRKHVCRDVPAKVFGQRFVLFEHTSFGPETSIKAAVVWGVHCRTYKDGK